MFNTNNCCVFEGRVSTDITAETVGQGKDAFRKVRFKIAVDRPLPAEVREKAKTDKSIVTADFVPMQATGKIAEYIEKYFMKGKAIKVFAAYRTWVTTDQQGNKKYGDGFDVEHASFTTADAKGLANGNSNGNHNSNGNGYHAPVQDVLPTDEDEIPF